MLVTLACTSSSDTNRDIFFAQQIATGQYFPLVGPVINNVLHMGPLWYYVLAIGIWLVPNAASAAFVMGLIGASQFPLAYRLGLRFGTSREAFLFVLALALPGYMVCSVVALTHVIAVVPSLLFGTLAALWYRERPDAAHAACLGLACAFMSQAHPTTLLLGSLLVMWSARKAPDLRTAAIHAGILVGIAVLPMLPVLYVQWHDGFPDAGATSEYMKSEWTMPSLVKAWELNAAIIESGPKYVARIWLQAPPAVVRILVSVYAALLVAAAIGLVLRFALQASRRSLIAILIALLAVQSMFVCALRATMPPWMIYAQWPLIAALVTLGLEYVWANGYRLGRAALATALVVTSAWSVAAWGWFATEQLELAEIQPSPGKHGVMDVREYEKTFSFYRAARLHFYKVFELGTLLCKPVSLYGHYGYLVDITQFVGAKQVCGTSDNVAIGGMPEPGRKPLLGFLDRAWEILGMQPQSHFDGLGFTDNFTVWRSGPPLHWDLPLYLNRPHRIAGKKVAFTVAGDASGSQAVMVSNRAHRYVYYQVLRARANGVEIPSAYDDITTSIFLSPWSGRNVHWEIDIEGDPDYVDVVAFAGNDGSATQTVSTKLQ